MVCGGGKVAKWRWVAEGALIISQMPPPPRSDTVNWREEEEKILFEKWHFSCQHYVDQQSAFWDRAIIAVGPRVPFFWMDKSLEFNDICTNGRRQMSPQKQQFRRQKPPTDFSRRLPLMHSLRLIQHVTCCSFCFSGTCNCKLWQLSTSWLYS